MLIHELLTAIVLAVTGPIADTGDTVDATASGPTTLVWFGAGRDEPRYQRVDDNDDDDDRGDDRGGDDDRDDRDDDRDDDNDRDDDDDRNDDDRDDA